MMRVIDISFRSLLTYGLILTEDQSNYSEAETFLRIVLEFYPQFIEGLVVLHLFYTRTDYSPGITKIDLCIGQKRD